MPTPPPVAVAAGAVWEVRPAGSDSNAGAFNPARLAGATDRTIYQDAAYKTGVNLVIDSVSVLLVTPDGYTPDALLDPGNHIQILSGTGFTLQIVEITGVSGGKWVLGIEAGTLGSTGGVWRMGGALASPGKVMTAIVSKNTVHVKVGTYLLGNTENISGGMVNLNKDRISWYGYTTVRQDQGQPTLKANANNVTCFRNGNNENLIEDFIFDGNKANVNGSRCFTTDGSRVLVRRCVAKNSKNTGFETSPGQVHLEYCQAYDNDDKGYSNGGDCYHCFATRNLAHGFQADNSNATFEGCVSYLNTGHGFTSQYPHVARNCVSVGNNKGWDLSNNWASLTNCISYGNTTNWSAGGATEPRFRLRNCAGNTVPSPTDFPNNVGFITLTVNPFVSTVALDFRLNNTAGGGALLRGAGYGIVPGAIAIDSRDVGAAQHAEGTPVFPTVGEVLAGIVYGATSELTGTLTVPGEDDVRLGINYGAGSSEFEGDLELPDISVVKIGVQYGANGIEFTGTYVPIPSPPVDPTANLEWLTWLGREDITLRVLNDPTGDSTDTYTDYGLTAASYDNLGGALRRAISRREIESNPGLYSGADAKWVIPKAVLPDGVTPRSRFKIIDGNGQIYNVTEVLVGNHGNTFHCIVVLER